MGAERGLPVDNIPIRYTFASWASAARGASMRLRARTTASPISRMGMSRVEDGIFDSLNRHDRHAASDLNRSRHVVYGENDVPLGRDIDQVDVNTGLRHHERHVAFSAFLGNDRTSALIEDLAHSSEQFLDADRLALEAVEPSGHDSRSVLGHYRGRDGDDWGGACHGVSPQPLQGFDTADAGELDVHQDERRMSLVREAHALFAGLGLDGLIPLDLQRIAAQLQVLGVVFDDENELIRHDAPES